MQLLSPDTNNKNNLDQSHAPASFALNLLPIQDEESREEVKLPKAAQSQWRIDLEQPQWKVLVHRFKEVVLHEEPDQLKKLCAGESPVEQAQLIIGVDEIIFSDGVSNRERELLKNESCVDQFNLSPQRRMLSRAKGLTINTQIIPENIARLVDKEVAVVENRYLVIKGGSQKQNAQSSKCEGAGSNKAPNQNHELNDEEDGEQESNVQEIKLNFSSLAKPAQRPPIDIQKQKVSHSPNYLLQDLLFIDINLCEVKFDRVLANPTAGGGSIYEPVKVNPHAMFILEESPMNNRQASSFHAQDDQSPFRRRKSSPKSNAPPKYIYQVQLQPFKNDHTWRSFIELNFENEEEFIHLRTLLGHVCLVAWPPLEKEYVFKDKLGSGSQAIVDLYKPRNIENKCKNDDDGYVSLKYDLDISKCPKQKVHQENNDDLALHQQQSPVHHWNTSIALLLGAQPQESFAVKKYTFDLSNKETGDYHYRMALLEIDYLRQLNQCENIVQIIQVYVERESGNSKVELKMVMKYAKYGTILKHLQKKQNFNEEEIRTVMAQLLLAVDLMHRKNIIHRDIKPDNILLMDRGTLQICISDLGLACQADDPKEVALKCGTPGYVAPEVLKNTHPFTLKADIFSVGGFFYNMVTSNNLFPGRNAQELLYYNKNQNPIPVVQTKVKGVSAECKSLLCSMLNVNPDQRPSAEECINHAWFQKDREALQNSLFINKNQHLIANLFNTPVNMEAPNIKECTSFMIAPNYFELVQCLSSNNAGMMNINTSQQRQANANIRHSAKVDLTPQGLMQQQIEGASGRHMVLANMGIQPSQNGLMTSLNGGGFPAAVLMQSQRERSSSAIQRGLINGHGGSNSKELKIINTNLNSLKQNFSEFAGGNDQVNQSQKRKNSVSPRPIQFNYNQIITQAREASQSRNLEEISIHAIRQNQENASVKLIISQHPQTKGPDGSSPIATVQQPTTPVLLQVQRSRQQSNQLNIGITNIGGGSNNSQVKLSQQELRIKAAQEQAKNLFMDYRNPTPSSGQQQAKQTTYSPQRSELPPKNDVELSQKSQNSNSSHKVSASQKMRDDGKQPCSGGVLLNNDQSSHGNGTVPLATKLPNGNPTSNDVNNNTVKAYQPSLESSNKIGKSQASAQQFGASAYCGKSTAGKPFFDQTRVDDHKIEAVEQQYNQNHVSNMPPPKEVLKAATPPPPQQPVFKTSLRNKRLHPQVSGANQEDAVNQALDEEDELYDDDEDLDEFDCSHFEEFESLVKSARAAAEMKASQIKEALGFSINFESKWPKEEKSQYSMGGQHLFKQQQMGVIERKVLERTNIHDILLCKSKEDKSLSFKNHRQITENRPQ
ncbi:hypothetical protein FGO68_gene4970 [Halteria grandinella]|uniref:Protein kinase domain-containing protein n=1 Tax=Halteria grandinella TaxID=5974 RepID=A0A8J8P1V7_HALGN|nr:hypothetical protein FGO68_gene4970 [Halteria grandinella]